MIWEHWVCVACAVVIASNLVIMIIAVGSLI